VLASQLVHVEDCLLRVLLLPLLEENDVGQETEQAAHVDSPFRGRRRTMKKMVMEDHQRKSEPTCELRNRVRKALCCQGNDD